MRKQALIGNRRWHQVLQLIATSLLAFAFACRSGIPLAEDDTRQSSFTATPGNSLPDVCFVFYRSLLGGGAATRVYCALWASGVVIWDAGMQDNRRAGREQWMAQIPEAIARSIAEDARAIASRSWEGKSWAVNALTSTGFFLVLPLADSSAGPIGWADTVVGQLDYAAVSVDVAEDGGRFRISLSLPFDLHPELHARSREFLRIVERLDDALGRAEHTTKATHIGWPNDLRRLVGFPRSFDFPPRTLGP